MFAIFCMLNGYINEIAYIENLQISFIFFQIILEDWENFLLKNVFLKEKSSKKGFNLLVSM